MNIRNYITFNRIVETGGFTKAAELLNYAQSTVTLHIQELENHYSEPLFDRIGKKLRLTELGERVYKESKKLESQHSKLENINNLEHKRVTIKIGVFDSLLLYRIHDLLMDFKRMHPNVNIVMKHGTCPELRRLVKEGELDITFLFDPLENFKEFKFHVLTEEKMALIFPKGENMELMTKANQTVYFTEGDCAYRRMFQNYLNKQGIIISQSIETGSIEVIKKYVGMGFGYSLLPMIAVKNSEDINAIPYPGPEMIYTQLIYHKDKYIFPEMQDFIDIVLEESRDWHS